MGPPGSGKGTQAKRLAAEFKIPHISTGDAFRAEVAAQTELGNRVKQIMESGQYVSDEITNQIVDHRLSAPDVSQGFILDGYPRTVDQAEALDAMAESKSLGSLRVVLFEIQKAELVDRLTGRLTCKDCGAVFHLRLNPPIEVGKCDKCGGQLIQREDDTEETVTKRIGVYESQTSPLVDFYRKAGVLSRVDASKIVDQVYEDLVKAISA